MFRGTAVALVYQVQRAVAEHLGLVIAQQADDGGLMKVKRPPGRCGK